MLLNLACSEMMAHYTIPHCGTSGSGKGWGTDLLTGGDLWMNHLSSCLGKVGLAPFVGGNFDSLAFSPASVIYADHVIKTARVFARGFTLDESSRSTDEIYNIGQGGNFLMSESTLDAVYGKSLAPDIWPSHTLESWLSAGSPDAQKLLKKHVIDLLNELKAPEDHDEIISKTNSS